MAGFFPGILDLTGMQQQVSHPAGQQTGALVTERLPQDADRRAPATGRQLEKLLVDQKIGELAAVHEKLPGELDESGKIERPNEPVRLVLRFGASRRGTLVEIRWVLSPGRHRLL